MLQGGKGDNIPNRRQVIGTPQVACDSPFWRLLTENALKVQGRGIIRF